MISRILFLASLAVLAAYAILLLYGSFLPFEWYMGYIATTTLKYKLGTRFTVEHYAAMIVRMRVIAGVVFVSILALLVFRRAVIEKIGLLCESWSELIKSLFARIPAAIREEKYLVGLLALFTVGGLVLRILYINQPMRHDEAFTYNFHASQSWLPLLSVYLQPNNQLTHTILARISIVIFGGAPWAIRLPALIIGTLIIPTSYVVFRRFFNEHVAIITSAVVATSHIMILYSTNARGYIVVSFLFLLLLGVTRTIRESDNFANWSLFVIITALLAYTVPSTLYAFAIVAVWFLGSIAIRDVTMPRRTLLVQFFYACLAIGAITLLLYSPVLAMSGFEPLYTDEFGNTYVAKDWNAFVARLRVHAIQLNIRWHDGLPRLTTAVLLFGVLLSTVLHRWVTRDRVPLIVAVIVGIVPLLLIQQLSPYIRTWLFLYPLYIALAFAGLQLLLTPRTHLVSMLGLIGALFVLAAIIPLPWIKYPLDLLASDGDAAGVYSPAFRSLLRQVGTLGVVTIVLSVGSWAIHRVPEHRSLKLAYYAVIALTLAGWQGANVIAQQTVCRSNETGAFRDASLVAEYLASDAVHGKTIVFDARSSATMEYAFLRMELPLEVLRYVRTPRTPDFLAPYRVGESLPDSFYVVVNENRQDSLEMILDDLQSEPGVSLDNFDVPTLVKTLPESKIYEMSRIATCDQM